VNHTRFPKKDHLPDWARRDSKVTKGNRVKYPLFLLDVYQNWIFFTDFRKTSNTKFHENPFCGRLVVPLGQTDTHRRDEPNSRISQILRMLPKTDHTILGSEMNSVRSGTITNGDL